MNRTPLVLVAATAALLTGAFARDARALGPIDLEVGAKAGVGTNPSSGPANPLGFGLGGRGGVSFFGFYGGLNLLYYFGGSTNVAGTDVSYHTLMYGLELGYNIKLAILTIRPQLGIGNAVFTAGPSGGPSTDSSNLYLEPGVTGLVSLGTVFVGADANLLLLPSVAQGDGSHSTQTAFTLHGQVGVRF